MFNNKKEITIFIVIFLLFMTSGFISAQDEIIDLKFKQPTVSNSDTSRTLQSLVKVRDISEEYSTGGLYLITHYGDLENLFEKENQELIDNPFINQTWRFCSLFSTNAKEKVLMGRNWDNQNVGSIIVSFYQPVEGYSSISFSRAIEMGFPINVGLDKIVKTPFGIKLLLAPFYAMDGINEHGLSVAVAGIKDMPVKAIEGKEQIFISYLIRKILDQTKTIDEVILLVNHYVPFLLNKNSLQAHLMVTEASGRSVILEYLDDRWQAIYPDHSWQVLTNKIVYQVPHDTLEEQCWRYRRISEVLENTNGILDWKTGLNTLRDVAQKGTTWSVIYSLTTRELYFSAYQSWDKIYHLRMD